MECMLQLVLQLVLMIGLCAILCALEEASASEMVVWGHPVLQAAGLAGQVPYLG